ncbi:phage portal protein [Demequina litorisediminis]|uniref:Phage portal protein n=1 Tax=Demequina litorisediminis TaxID=1849022 RepID=A0ABQ6IAJ8_9MICO|nr:phage portal protein [Demequina litorisediminis]GMA34736.1 phage portal protein [Demequina litorisediminis]
MGILSWLGFNASEHRDTETPEGVMPPRRSAASEVNTDTALSLVAVYRAVSILSTAASQLSLDVWRGREQIDTPLVARRPDVAMPLSEWLAETVNSLALTGNAYWRITRDDRGPRNIEVLDPWKCSPQEDGTLGYESKRLQPSEFRHLKLMPRAGVLYGLGPIQAARAEIAGALDLRNYSSAWFASGDTPSGVLSSDQHLTAEQAKQYKDIWNQREAHEVAVMGAGLSYSPVMLNPEDAQFIANRQFTTTEIARLFGVPAHLMLAAVEGTSLTYTNVAQADLTFVRWSLMTYLRAIESALSEVLPGQQSARFNLDALLRPDTTTRYTAHQIALTAGFLTVDEVRDIEGLPPLASPTSPEVPADA